MCPDRLRFVPCALLAGYFPATRGKIIALNSSVSNVGSLLAPITAGAMLLIMDWRQVFMIVTFMSLAMGWFISYSEIPASPQRRRPAPARPN
ncbi:MAG: hypothetical protein DSY88_05370 [Candidatus Poseidoniales archaeon]|nr:MAG: hypothetical protein DSY88_05370 [Candidatus Poseidoniales archaeon]